MRLGERDGVNSERRAGFKDLESKLQELSKAKFQFSQKKSSTAKCLIFKMVPGAGLEPARLAAGDFESPESTNFTTRAGNL